MREAHIPPVSPYHLLATLEMYSPCKSSQSKHDGEAVTPVLFGMAGQSIIKVML